MVSRQVLNVSREIDPTASLGSLFQGSASLWVQKFSLLFRWGFLFPIALCPVTGHHWQESGRVLLTPTLQIFLHIDKIPFQSSLPAKQTQLPQSFPWEMLQSPHHFHSTPLDLPQQFLVFLELGSPELDTTLQMWPHQSRGEGLHLNIKPAVFSNQ